MFDCQVNSIIIGIIKTSHEEVLSISQRSSNDKKVKEG